MRRRGGGTWPQPAHLPPCAAAPHHPDYAACLTPLHHHYHHRYQANASLGILLEEHEGSVHPPPVPDPRAFEGWDSVIKSQMTLLDMAVFGPVVDEALLAAGIRPACG